MKRKTQQLKEYLIRKGVSTPATPIDQAETVLYRSAGTGNKQGAKLQYLRKIITDNGGTPQGKYESEAVIALGKVPSKRLSENWRKIYGA